MNGRESPNLNQLPLGPPSRGPGIISPYSPLPGARHLWQEDSQPPVPEVVCQPEAEAPKTFIEKCFALFGSFISLLSLYVWRPVPASPPAPPPVTTTLAGDHERMCLEGRRDNSQGLATYRIQEQLAETAEAVKDTLEKLEEVKDVSIGEAFPKISGSPPPRKKKKALASRSNVSAP